MTPPDWPTADKAYQAHHANCPTCRAAGTAPGSRERRFESQATRRRQHGAVVLDHAHQGADFIGVLFSSSCERFRLAVSFSV